MIMQQRYLLDLSVDLASATKDLLVQENYVAQMTTMTDGLMWNSLAQTRAVLKTIVLVFQTRVRRMQMVTI